MRLQLPIYFLSLVLLLLGNGCSNFKAQSSTPLLDSKTSKNGLTRIMDEESVEIWATEADRQSARDVFKSIRENSDPICSALKTECRFPILVEIYPDQGNFDQYVMNPEMHGFFAISGVPHTIQMVSPLHPSPHNISYPEGVSVAVHEFVHLVLDEINPAIPTWLDEGTAVYLGPHEAYASVCQEAFPFSLMTSFWQLEEDYNSVQAPDLFAYTTVDFIVSSFGMEKLNRLLREPEKMEEVLGIPKKTFEENWSSYIQTHCHNEQSITFPTP